MSEELILAKIMVFFDHKVDIDQRDNFGNTLLMLSCCWRKIELLSLLIDIEKEIRIKIEKKNQFESISLMKNEKKDEDITSMKEIILLLLRYGANVNATDDFGSTSLLLSISTHHQIEIILLLLDYGAKVNVRNHFGETPLLCAVDSGYHEIVSILFDYVTDEKEKNDSLILASQNGHQVVVLLLLDRGVDVNAKDQDSNTSLIEASRYGHSETVSILLDHGADVDAINNSGNTALDCTNISDIRILLSKFRVWNQRKHFLIFSTSTTCQSLSLLTIVMGLEEMRREISSFL
jgi:ankyrin repeat protein